MLTVTSARAGQGVARYTANAVDFDGTADYMNRGADLTGNANSKSGIFSVWIRYDGGDGVRQQLLHGTGGIFAVSKAVTTNLFTIEGYTAAPVQLLLMRSSAITAGAAWRHILASWDLATTTTHLYVDGVDDNTTVTAVDDAIDYTLADYAVGATTTGTNLTNSCIAELYFAPGQYLDFSVAANRLKFRSAAGKPVSLGSDGSLPTGTAPIMYLANPAASFQTNLGTGGDFTVTGTLTAASTSPSD